MIFDSTPIHWTAGEQLSPDKINRIFVTAVKQIESVAERRYRYIDVALPAYTDGYDNVIEVPRMFGFQVFVDRVTFSGTYTGQPTISWRLAGESSARASLTFPANGNEGAEYAAVLLPGAFLDGVDSSTNLANFRLQSDTTLPNMRCTITLKTCRDDFLSTSKVPALHLYKDSEIFDGYDFNQNLNILQDFVDERALNTVFPPNIVYAQLTNLAGGATGAANLIRIPTGSYDHVRMIVGRIKMATAGSGGQTVAIEHGFGTASNLDFVSVDGQTNKYFDITPSPSYGPSNNNPNSSTDDLVLQISNSAFGSTVDKIEIFVLFSPLIDAGP